MEISIIFFWRLAMIVCYPFTNNYMDLKNYYSWDNTYLNIGPYIYPRIPQNTQEYPQRTCEYPWKTEKQIEFFDFPETTKNYQNLIKMITMKIHGTISWHNSCSMFKKENCAQKQQIIIGIGKLAEVIKTNLGDQYN
jgi:hypothetical protein